MIKILQLLKYSFYVVNKNIILIVPMIFMITGIIAYINALNVFMISNQQAMLAYFALWILISGCSAGWFYVVRKTLQYNNRMFIYENDRDNARKHLFASFFKGIGRLFIPFLFVVGFLFLACAAQKQIYEFIVPKLNDFFTYNMFQVILFILVSCVSYWFMLWLPEIAYNQRDPFKALFNSTKNAFITFPKTIFLFLVIWVIVLGVYILFYMAMLSTVLSFFVLLLSYYLVFYIVILVYIYYEQNFLE